MADKKPETGGMEQQLVSQGVTDAETARRVAGTAFDTNVVSNLPVADRLAHAQENAPVLMEPAATVPKGMNLSEKLVGGADASTTLETTKKAAKEASQERKEAIKDVSMGVPTPYDIRKDPRATVADVVPYSNTIPARILSPDEQAVFTPLFAPGSAPQPEGYVDGVRVEMAAEIKGTLAKEAKKQQEALRSLEIGQGAAGSAGSAGSAGAGSGASSGATGAVGGAGAAVSSGDAGSSAGTGSSGAGTASAGAAGTGSAGAGTAGAGGASGAGSSGASGAGAAG